MNERQPYEQHLAEKLQQLPPPLESDKTWEQMKVLLDNELPRGTGSGGNGRWWTIGMIAGILLIGTWWFMQQPGEKTTAKELTAIETTGNKPGHPNTDASAGSQAPQNQPGHGNNPQVNIPDHGDQAIASTAQTDISAARRSNDSDGNHQFPAINNKKANSDAARTEQQVMPDKQKVGRKFPPPRDPVVADLDIGQRTSPVKIIDHNKLPAYTENSTQPATNKKQSDVQTEKPGSNLQSQSALTIDASEKKSNRSESAKADPVGSMPALDNTEQSTIQTQQLLPDQLSVTSIHDGASKFLPPGTNPKKIRRKAETPERAFAIGLSLPLAFPVADQKALGYNFRGGANTVSDYIPSPHVQYHLNRRTYFQTEVQVVAPQYIRPVLLYQEKTQDGPGAWMYNSVFAKKLYYFNLPVSVYHSPMPNFFLGTGVQFSSLVSGVGMYENKKVYNNQETVLRQQYNRISHDSLTNRMSNSEIRLLLDVNYYWQKFTVGLRYNQAFGNYIGFRLNNTTGYTYDKNKALFFYLRYNIWEDSKRKKPAKSMLSLK